MKRACEKCGLPLGSGGFVLGGVLVNVHAKKCPTEPKANRKESRKKWNQTWAAKRKTPEILPDYKIRRSVSAI